MERQHGRVADTLADVLGVLPAWQASATADRRDEIVGALDAHRRVLIEHLDDEEAHLLPLAARHLTGPEWAALGEHFVATTPKAQLLVFLGAVLEEATVDERAALLGAMPVVARLAWRSVGRRRYSSYIRHVRGNPGPRKRPDVGQEPHGGVTMSFSEPELAFLSSQTLGRLATVQPDGTLQVNPVGFTYNAELNTFDIHGYRLSTSRKFRNIADNGRAAFVIDDVPSVDPWRVRCLEIRGHAQAITSTGQTQAGLDGALIRIHPTRIISFGIDIPDQEPHTMTPHNRDVAPR